MNPLNHSLQRAMRLMQSGDLRAATDAIQQGLVSNGPLPARNEDTFHRSDACANSDYIDVEFSVVSNATATEKPENSPVPPRGSQGAFEQHQFFSDAGQLDYKLYIPAGLDTAQAPLLLMLHGCKQTPDDFARGTRMNTLADLHKYVVAYPEQPTSRNATHCWNWFRRSDQKRESGEPALLAGLTRQLIANHGLDPRRVYVAGLSAGGAMAAILADTYPDLFAAIGVHSGLPTGLAKDVPSAFAAMRDGRSHRSPIAAKRTLRAVPAIVFHGDKDTTVHPDNGYGLIEQSLGTGNTGSVNVETHAHVERGTAAGGRRYTRTSHKAPDGSIAAEHWVIEGSGHAWSGGDAAGSFTDAQGPDASAQMMRFFSIFSRSR